MEIITQTKENASLYGGLSKVFPAIKDFNVNQALSIIAKAMADGMVYKELLGSPLGLFGGNDHRFLILDRSSSIKVKQHYVQGCQLIVNIYPCLLAAL